MSSHYDILGIPRRASAKDVVRAYERRMKGLGKNPDALQERMVRDAYSVLSNPVKRADYDSRLGEDDVIPTGAGSSTPLIVGIIVVAVTAAAIGFFLTTRAKDQKWMEHEEKRAADREKGKKAPPSPPQQGPKQ